MNFNDALPQSKPSGGIHNFDAVEPAPQMELIPGGVYIAVVVHGELVQTRSGNDGYRIKFKIIEGPHAGRFAFRTWSFSERALAYAKRDLAQFGLTSSAMLLAPFPPVGREYRVKLWIVLQRGDDGREFNDIKKLDVIRIDKSPIAEFILPTQAGGGPK
jgi:hypothetical protein